MEPYGINSPVARCISEEIKQVSQLILVLEEEQADLKQGRADRLELYATRKQKHLQLLAQIETPRLKALKNLQLPAGPEGMTNWAGKASPQAKAQWEHLLTLLSMAKEVNRINGVVITERLGENQQALQMLMSAGDRLSLYGPNGQTQIGGVASIRNGKPLGSA